MRHRPCYLKKILIILNLLLTYFYHSHQKNIKIKSVKPLSKAKIRNYKKLTAITINIKKLNIPRVFKIKIKKSPLQSIFNKK